MIKYHKKAEKFILSQNKTIAFRIYTAIEKLPLGDVKPLKGKMKPQLYRLRIGDFRVIFIVEKDTINILDIDNRGDIYKR